MRETYLLMNTAEKQQLRGGRIQKLPPWVISSLSLCQPISPRLGSPQSYNEVLTVSRDPSRPRNPQEKNGDASFICIHVSFLALLS